MQIIFKNLFFRCLSSAAHKEECAMCGTVFHPQVSACPYVMAGEGKQCPTTDTSRVKSLLTGSQETSSTGAPGSQHEGRKGTPAGPANLPEAQEVSAAGPRAGQ